MKKTAIIPAWGRILRGYNPFLSIEITRECPLKCPGCYVYEQEHLNNGVVVRQLRDLKGQALVEGVLGLVRRFRPIHVSLVGGEPLVRHRELGDLIPKLDSMGIEVQLVTSAVRPIPQEWAALSNFHLVVSVDGLENEHDARRSPATYARILKHVAGHQIIVHCTITRQLLSRDGYLGDFSSYWSQRQEVRKIWFSLFTPQQGEQLEERLTPQNRRDVIEILGGLQDRFPKVYMPGVVLDGYRKPPKSAAECLFAQMTTCISADLTTPVLPCQIGGKPLCSECGCIASAGLSSIANTKLAGLVRVFEIFSISKKFGSRFHHE
jgi:organic radical activating enzyme